MRKSCLLFLRIIVLLALVSLACQITPGVIGDGNFKDAERQSNQAGDNQPTQHIVGANASPEANQGVINTIATSPSTQQAAPAGFLESDCAVSGVVFQDITVDYLVDDIYDGPYLICSISTTGAHGLSESLYFRIVAYKPSLLPQYYRDLQTSIQSWVDQANEWNSTPGIPESAMDTITFLHDDGEGYVFLITSEASVQGRLIGDGFGAEMVNGKYLVQLEFSSCEGDAGVYEAALQQLENAALAAIQRVEVCTTLIKPGISWTQAKSETHPGSTEK